MLIQLYLKRGKILLRVNKYSGILYEPAYILVGRFWILNEHVRH